MKSIQSVFIKSGFIRRYIFLTVIVLCFGLIQCTSVKNKTLGPSAQFSTEPFVEAYLEYPGPRRLWAGPQTVIYHITAKDGEEPTLLITPATFQSMNKPALDKAPAEDGSIEKRSLASDAEHQPKILVVGTKLKMPVAAVRDDLNEIIDQFEDHEHVASGCTYPVKMKLVRINGAVVEKSGCRGSGAWTQAVSEAVSRFLASASSVQVNH